jgi:alkylated DNA repair protein (DNA oxidative demethylase)
MTLELFDQDPPWSEEICEGTWLFHGRAIAQESALLAALRQVEASAPFRHMTTPGGHQMSVAMTNCGSVGWVSDRRGYRYQADDPISGRPWPDMPAVFADLARQAALDAGFAGFDPDVCLINRYQPGAKMGLHQDKDETDFAFPIVSVSLGLPAVFVLGGSQRNDKTQRIPLLHGDVLVWGGVARLRYHGVLTLKPGDHHQLGPRRINLTFRKAG